MFTTQPHPVFLGASPRYFYIFLGLRSLRFQWRSCHQREWEIQGGVEIFPVASYYRNRDKLLLDESLGLYTAVGGFRSDIDLIFNFSDWKAPSKLCIVENFQPRTSWNRTTIPRTVRRLFKNTPKSTFKLLLNQAFSSYTNYIFQMFPLKVIKIWFLFTTLTHCQVNGIWE